MAKKTDQKTQSQNVHKHPIEVQAYSMDLCSMEKMEESQCNHPDDHYLQQWALLHLLYVLILVTTNVNCLLLHF